MYMWKLYVKDGCKNLFVAGDNGSGTIRIRLRSTDGLLVSTELSADARTVFAACSILRSILRATGPVYEQHEDACSRRGGLATDASYRGTPDSECALATRPAAHYGNIHHATSVPYAMKLIVDRLIVTYDIVVLGSSRGSFRHIPTSTFTFGFSVMQHVGQSFPRLRHEFTANRVIAIGRKREANHAIGMPGFFFISFFLYLCARSIRYSAIKGTLLFSFRFRRRRPLYRDIKSHVATMR